jgi:RNA polymerase sigma-70 factor (ECF subfamily)
MAEAPLMNPEALAQDERLLALAKAGPEGVGAVYDAYADRLYGFLLKRCGHKETAEDLVSRVFIKFIEQLPNLEWRGVSLGAWLFRVASNALTDHWRSATVRMDLQLDTDTWDPPAPEDKPSWYAELSLEKDKMANILKHLSPRDQEVLDLRFFAGCEIPEIAELLAISTNHASVLVYRATGRLRTKYLQTYGGLT